MNKHWFNYSLAHQSCSTLSLSSCLYISQGIMEKKKQKVHEKHQALLQELQLRAQTAAQELEGEVRRDTKDMRQMAKERAAKVHARLDKKMEEIRALQLQYTNVSTFSVFLKFEDSVDYVCALSIKLQLDLSGSFVRLFPFAIICW